MGGRSIAALLTVAGLLDCFFISHVAGKRVGWRRPLRPLSDRGNSLPKSTAGSMNGIEEKVRL